MAVITGTLANDTLFGTNDTSDLIEGLDGDDIIYVGAGKWSNVYGGLGNDRIIAGSNTNNFASNVRDYLYGGEGDDTYVYNMNSVAINVLENDVNAGSNTLEFGVGINLADLYINMGPAGFSVRHSLVWKNDADIVVYGLSGQHFGVDEIVFANGDTYSIASDGTLTASDDDNVIYMARGAHKMSGGAGNDIIHGTEQGGLYGGKDQIWGGDGDDQLFGYEGGGDVLYGGAGDDYLHAGTGNESDALYGGTGNDIMIGSNISSGGYSTYFEGGDGDDKIYVNGYNATAYAENGSDEMHVDYMVQQNTAGVLVSLIQLRGGSDNDVYLFNKDDSSGLISRKSKIIDDSGLYDTIVLSGDWNPNELILQYGGIGLDPDTSVLYNVIEINTNFANNYVERVVFSNGDIYAFDQLTSSMSQITATNGNDTLYLSAWHDTFDALDGDDTIYALERDDVVDGGAGDDTLYGEHGNDTLIGGLGNDTLNGGIGSDTVDYSSAAAGVNVVLSGDVTLDDGDGGSDVLASIENAIGSNFNDTLKGDNGANVITANDGADTIYTYNGDDVIDGGVGNDYINAGNNNDIVNGGAGHDRIYAGKGDDVVYGGDGVDRIYASEGNDVIDGGAGNDYLYGGGGTGSDTFVFNDISNFWGGTVLDHVYYFDAAADVLDISDLVSGYDALTEDINDYVDFYQYGTSTLLRVDIDGANTGYNETNIARLYNFNGWENLDVQTLVDNGSVII